MLAKTIKIQNLYVQREYIERKLLMASEKGDPSFIYEGHIYPENVDYFQQQGIVINRASVVIDPKVINALPAHLITISPALKLTREELSEAKKYYDSLKQKNN